MPDATKKSMDDELAGESTRRLLKIIAAAGLLGGAARGGLSVFRNANPRYDPPEVPKPTIVDFPYPVPAAPPISAIPPAGREKKQLAAKVAVEYPPWAQNLGAAGRGLHDILPTYIPPTGLPGEKKPENVPVFGAAMLGAAAGGGFGGYHLTDKLLRAADRWRARRDLESAKREYQAAITSRLAGTDLSSKSAATDAPTPEAVAVKEAVDKLYDAVKAAKDGYPLTGTPNPNPDPASRTAASLLWPGLNMGPEGARINAMLAGMVGLGGGYMGYNFTRDADVRQKARKQIKEVDRANTERIHSPMIARLVPVPQNG